MRVLASALIVVVCVLHGILLNWAIEGTPYSQYHHAGGFIAGLVVAAGLGLIWKETDDVSVAA